MPCSAMGGTLVLMLMRWGLDPGVMAEATTLVRSGRAAQRDGRHPGADADALGAKP